MDWELDDAWRPVVERLAERVATWPSTAPEPADFCVAAPVDVLWHKGVLVWTWTGANGAVCLGGQFDTAGLRCGALNPHNPGDHLDTWYVVARHGRTLESLADEFLGWIARENPTPPTPATPPWPTPSNGPDTSTSTARST